MSLKLKNKLTLRFIFLLGLIQIGLVSVIYFSNKEAWFTWDYRIVDKAYEYKVKKGLGPSSSDQIIYVPITDESYQFFGQHTLDRRDLAKINNVLNDLDIRALAYDVIFARASSKEADVIFKDSISRLGSVFLPVGLAYTESKTRFRREGGAAYERFENEFVVDPKILNEGDPIYAKSGLMQHDAFALAAAGSGHISSSPDNDGVFRHVITLIKVENKYFPTLSLAMYLHANEASLDDAKVKWGDHILIESNDNNDLEQDLIIPIDRHGRTYIPFPQTWEKDFEKVTAHELIKLSQNESISGNLNDLFEDKYVFIGDISIGTSDLGRTALEEEVPLIVIHTAFLNALINKHFYSQLADDKAYSIVVVLSLLLLIAAAVKSNGLVYFVLFIEVLGVTISFWYLLSENLLIPIVTLIYPVILLFIAITILTELLARKDRAFIKSTFARYLPEAVINHLLSHPESLTLGGEEREMTVLFSDIEGFTSLAEKMNPESLVSLLNEYLSEMTKIILEHGGIIDKYQGDAIMAEFGAPLALEDHAERAVKAALKMHQRLDELVMDWKKRDLPALKARIGINTGSMIIGNMGSDKVFDYTVIGDAVNLAARLESANKQYGTDLMISKYTMRRLPEKKYHMRFLDIIKVKGKEKAVEVYHLYGSNYQNIHEAYLSYYKSGLESYLHQEFDIARQAFESALKERKGDLAAQRMLTRIEQLEEVELPENWDGSYEMREK